jgi:hypothetical protein
MIASIALSCLSFAIGPLAAIIRGVDGKVDVARGQGWAILAHPGFSGCHDGPVGVQSALADLLSQVKSCDGTAQIDIEKAEQALADWNKRSAWQPIETAPRDGTWVLLAGGECESNEESDNRGRVVTARWTTEFNDFGRWEFAYYDSIFYLEYENPTHWQPLPSPPITPNPHA